MSWLEAGVTVFQSLIWPAVVIVVLLVLRTELPALVKRLSRFSAGGIEAVFADQVAATSDLAEVAAPDAPAELPDAAGGTLVREPTLADLEEEAAVHPVGAMVRAWNLVERVVDFRSGPVHGSFDKMIRFLREDGLLTEEMLAVARRLNTLRNMVIHGQVIPTPAEAKEFITAAWRLAAFIDRPPGSGRPSR